MESANEERFEFGDNWQRYLTTYFNEEHLAAAQVKLESMLGVTSLRGSSFLDIGSGSGIHSLAAARLGCAPILSVDLDPKSVQATASLRDTILPEEWWTVKQGSILDEDFVRTLGQWQFVYCWGVLHHTGNVWKGLAHTLELVKPGGILYLALYSADVQINPGPEYWLTLKQRYLRAGPLTRRLMEIAYIIKIELTLSPDSVVRLWRKIRKPDSRGMRYMSDVRDWLGGWPMEFVWDSEVLSFTKERGFELLKMETGEANTEFILQRK